MPPFRPTYRVERIAAPVLGRHGALSGVPVVEVRLSAPGSPGIPLSLDGVVREINALYPAGGPVMPRWVHLCGSPHPDAHDLVVGFQVLLKRLVYTETDGVDPMGNIGKLPLFDHVAVAIPRLPVQRIATELFHSVMAPFPRRPESVDAIDRFLTSREYNGHRFLVPFGPVTPANMEVLSRHARLWRVSPGPVPHPAPALSPAFAKPRHALQRRS